ncbi:MAG: hypothetical protein ACRC7O_07080 [Fimbriiglobus sp.]
MTALGKMLVFLVLVLSLVWNGLVANAYVTRSNWKAELKKYQDKSVEAAESANSLRKLVDAEQDAAEDSKRVLREEITRLYTQKATLETQKAGILKDYEEKLASEKQRGNDEGKLQANNNALLKQVDNLTAAMQVRDQEINKLTLETETARAARLKAELEAASQQLRADRFAEQLLLANEKMAELKLGPSRSAVEPRAAAPAGFRGTVRARKDDLVSFTPGLDAGLKVGTTLTVFRQTPTPKYLGKLTVIQVDPKEAVGRFVPPPGRAAADDFPKPDDELKD